MRDGRADGGRKTKAGLRLSSSVSFLLREPAQHRRRFGNRHFVPDLQALLWLIRLVGGGLENVDGGALGGVFQFDVSLSQPIAFRVNGAAGNGADDPASVVHDRI